VGIGRPPGRMDPADYVLRDFSGTERKELPFALSDAVDAVLLAVRQGWSAAQEKVNGERRSRQA
jgi:PTH1 family peptidyl-tRNA hydrolase